MQYKYRRLLFTYCSEEKIIYYVIHMYQFEICHPTVLTFVCIHNKKEFIFLVCFDVVKWYQLRISEFQQCESISTISLLMTYWKSQKTIC